MKCQAFVDWLTFSVKRKEPKEVIVEFLGLESSAFPALFRLLAAEEGANISRIDIACDDRTKSSKKFSPTRSRAAWPSAR